MEGGKDERYTILRVGWGHGYSIFSIDFGVGGVRARGGSRGGVFLFLRGLEFTDAFGVRDSFVKPWWLGLIVKMGIFHGDVFFVMKGVGLEFNGVPGEEKCPCNGI